MSWLAGLLGGIGSLAGGFLNWGAQKDANEANERMNDVNWLRSQIASATDWRRSKRSWKEGRIAQLHDMNRQERLAKQFARFGIRWQTADMMAAAKKHGIHPMALMGMNPAQGPTLGVAGGAGPSVPGSSVPGSIGAVPETGLGDAVAGFGQNIAASVDAASSADARAYEAQVAGLQLENLRLQNDAIRTQIAGSTIAITRQAGNPPAVPMPGSSRYLVDGQGQAAVTSPLVVDVPMERIAPAPENSSVEPAAVPASGFGRSPTGLMPVYSADIKQRLEDDVMGSLFWNLRNRVLPAVSGIWENLPPADPGTGKRWRYNPFVGEYQAVDSPISRRAYWKNSARKIGGIGRR